MGVERRKLIFSLQTLIVALFYTALDNSSAKTLSAPLHVEHPGYHKALFHITIIEILKRMKEGEGL